MFVEHEVAEGIGEPNLLAITTVLVEDLAIVVGSSMNTSEQARVSYYSIHMTSRYRIADGDIWEAGGVYSRNVAVDDLNEDQVTIVRHDVKGLGLDIGKLLSLPFQVLLGHNRVRSLGGLLGNRLDRLRAIDGLLRAHRR